MTPFEILLLAGAADVKLSKKTGLNIYKLGFMLKNGQNTIFFYHFYPQNRVFVGVLLSPGLKGELKCEAK